MDEKIKMERANLKIVNNDEDTTEVNKEPVSTSMPAPPSTIYEVLMSRMTPDQLASLGVKLISVNNSELFWVTTTGQLYNFDSKQRALEAEYAWLMSTPK